MKITKYQKNKIINGIMVQVEEVLVLKARYQET